MPTIPYVDADIPGPIPDAIRRRRDGDLLELDRMLLHNPAIASGWNALLGAVRTESRLADSEREIAICQVAVLNNAEYEWLQHAPIAIKAGIPEEVMTALKKGKTDGLNTRHRLVVELTTSMTERISVADELVQRVRTIFGDEGYHDLVAVIATYNMVSRYLVALQVGQ